MTERSRPVRTVVWLRRRQTFANVAAVLALVLASSGVAYAANTVRSSDSVDNTIRSRDVRNGTLTSADVADNSLRAGDLTAGEEIVIAKAGQPMARLVANEPRREPRQFGRLRGRIRVADDFDDTPESVIDAFES